MNTQNADRSTRIVRWWARRYTAGLPHPYGAERRAEIDSDLAEHRLARVADGWTHRRIARERLTRLLGGAPADLAWRHELLHRATNRVTAAATAAAATVASLLLAAFHFVFAAYLLGTTSLADRRFLGGLDAYAEEVGRPVASAIAAAVIGSLGLVLVFAAVTRPVSPLMANAATTSVASLSVVFFWLGAWPVALIAVAGALTDLAVRSSTATPPR
jgi:hypothetical protein